MAKLIAADLGGTKVFFQCFETETDQILAESRYECANFDAFETIVETFLTDFQLSEISGMAIGLPAPVTGRSVKLTNLPWQVDADILQTRCQIERVLLINDFYAAALGVDALNDNDIVCLHDRPINPTGNRLVIGAGTGLGIAPVKNCQGLFMPQASEGGHMDFAPLNSTQTELLNWLLHRWRHVSYERVLSGEGIENLYHFFNARAHGMSHQNVPKDTSAEKVHQLAENGDPIAIDTLDTFVEIYGAFIGNAALIWQAEAGIYVGGGIAPKLIDWMQKPIFIDSYLHKGRMKKVVDAFPIYLVKNEQVGLLGAKLYIQQNLKTM